MSIWTSVAVALGLMSAPHPAAKPVPPLHDYVVRLQTISDDKSVFATVDTANVVPARARVGGTVVKINVRQGDHVTQGQVIAVVGDKKLGLSLNAAAAQAEAAKAQLAQATADYDRAQRLKKADAISQSAFDAAKTAYEVAQHNVAAQGAQQAVAGQQLKEGEILAPTSGRVLTVPVTVGTVMMPGDSAATVAEENYVLRLLVPERHARFLKAGDPVRIEGSEIGMKAGAHFGTITLVYPQITGGRVQADATLPGLTDYFVGERVQVWISAGQRQAIVIPARFVFTRAGIDYARVRGRSGAMDVPVERGDPHPTPSDPDGLEILSGLRPGDALLSAPGPQS